MPVLINRNEDGELLVSVTPDDWLHGPSMCLAFLASGRERFDRFTPIHEFILVWWSMSFCGASPSLRALSMQRS